MKPRLFSLVAALLTAVTAAETEGEPWICHSIDNSFSGADGVKLDDINRDGLKDIAVGWEEGGLTRVYLNPGMEKAKEPWPAVTVGKTPSVEDAVFVDLDGDGATDVVSSCEGRERAMQVQWAPKGLDDLLNPDAWTQQVLPASKQLGQQWMFATALQVDGKHGTDLIAGSKNKGAQVGWFEAPRDARDLDAWKWHPISEAGWIMSIRPVDMDGDRDLDVVVTDRMGKLRGCHWFENPGVGDAQKQRWKRHCMGGQDKEVMFMCLSDLDRDGLQDAVVAVRGMELLWLRRLDGSGAKWETHVIPVDCGSGNPKAVEVVNLTPDNHPDLLVTTGEAEGKHGVFWLKGDGTPLDGGWEPRAISGMEKGIKYDRIEMLDVDGDGDLDLLTCEENEGPGSRGMGVIWYQNPTGKSHP